MADHEIDLRGGILGYEVRCICEPDEVIGRFGFESKARAAFKAHQDDKGVKPPKAHDIRMVDDLLGFGVSCGCSCDEVLGHFSNKKSAVLAWRKHANK